MTEFTPIKQAKENLKGNIFGVIVKIGDLKSGTASKGDWTMKLITIDDGSDMVDMAAFGESEYSQFVIGAKYEIENLWWKQKDGKLFLTLGKFAKVKLVSEVPTSLKQETITTENNNSKLQQPTTTTSNQTQSLPKLSQAENKIITAESTKLFQIKQKVNETIGTYEIQPNQGMIWQMTEIIYNSFLKNNFTKANGD